MKRLIRFFVRFLLVFVLIIMLTVGGAYGYVHVKMHTWQTPYTETVEQILMDLVPEEGIVVRGRYYDAWSVYNFLEEIRYDPYNYVHKDHHCVLQYVPQEYIYWIVSVLRICMGCR